MDMRNLPLLSLYRANLHITDSFINPSPPTEAGWIAKVEDFCESLYAIFKVEEDYPVLRHCFMESIREEYEHALYRHTPLSTILDTSTLLTDTLYQLLIQHDAYIPEGILLYHYLWLDLPDTIGFATKGHDRLRRDPLLDILETDHAIRFFSSDAL
jgi:hypothetical protein